ncbi:hypothetical protein H0H92_002033 [Tricholoma furcatifolium]|nr:hypothetical protein H0H92_002033 [Tricholoma furcatifolium]
MSSNAVSFDYETSKEAVPPRNSGTSLPQEERLDNADQGKDKDKVDDCKRIEDERNEDESIAPPQKHARTTICLNTVVTYIVSLVRAKATSGMQLFLDLEASVSDDEEGDEEGDEDGVENFINDEYEGTDNKNPGQANLIETLEALGISHESNTAWTEVIAHAQRRARESRSDKGKGKDKGHSHHRKRPQQALLTIAEAVHLFRNANVERLLDEPLENNCFMFKIGTHGKSTLITYGFVSKETLNFDLVTPSDMELGQFFSQDLFTQLQSDSRSQQALKNLAALRLQPGDPVRICTGELIGMMGVVHGLEVHDVALVVVNGALLAGEVTIPKVNLCALYKVGDRVKVIYGKHRGEMGFIVGIEDEFLALHNHRKTIDNPANEVQFVVPVHSVQFYAEALVVTRAGPPTIQKIPFGKTAENDYVGRLVQVIHREKFKMYEGHIIKLYDSDNTKVEVQLLVKLAHAKGKRVVILLSHLCDRNDPTKKSLLDDTPQKTRSRLDQDMTNHEPIVPPVPRSSVHRCGRDDRLRVEQTNERQRRTPPSN